MELQQGNIVVQGLAVVVVMDVGGGHAQGLSPGTAVFPGQIVVAHTHIDGIPGANNAEEINIMDFKKYFYHFPKIDYLEKQTFDHFLLDLENISA